MARNADSKDPVPPTPEAIGHRRGRGSLAGMVEIAEDWDSTETNADIADEFER